MASRTKDNITYTKYPTKNTWLFLWAAISAAQIRRLAELALPELWYFKDAEPGEREALPILRNYLARTFQQLCAERKIRVKYDPVRQEEYAAFHTGLADRRYQDIYALFRADMRYQTEYWYLVDFVTAGEEIGKKLVSLFRPLPKKADYFGGRPEAAACVLPPGRLPWGCTHILTERADRLPLRLLRETCSPECLRVDGVELEDAYRRPFDEEKKAHFLKLGQSLLDHPEDLGRLRGRFAEAVARAGRRAAWNYRTAVPMYYPKRRRIFFLLPLSFFREDRTDLALVVERQPSGACLGQTVLSLDFAYCSSRLIAPPDSSWLRPELIPAGPASP